MCEWGVCVCEYVCMCVVCIGALVEVSGQLVSVGSLLPPHGSWEWEPRLGSKRLHPLSDLTSQLLNTSRVLVLCQTKFSDVLFSLKL